MVDNSNFVKIGVVGKAHGLNGLFFVSQRTSLFIESVKYIYLENKSNLKKLRLDQVLSSGGKTVFKCDTINNRQDLSKYMGSSIYVERKDLNLKEDEFLWNDLIGRVVLDSYSNNFGTIEKVEDFGAGVLVFITHSDSSLSTIPFNDQYFNMDFDSKSKDPIYLRYDSEFYSDFKNK